MFKREKTQNFDIKSHNYDRQTDILTSHLWHKKWKYLHTKKYLSDKVTNMI